MACVQDSDSVALSTDSGILEADVKISADPGNRASIHGDGVFVAGDFIETGDLVWSGRTSKTGFLIGDGAAVSRSTYADLFAIFGTTYGAGDGSTTFNMPDVQGRGIVGKGTHASVNALGANEGIVTVANRTSKHNSTPVDPGHTHRVWTENNSPGNTQGFAFSGGGSNRFPGVVRTGDVTIPNVGSTGVAETTGITVGPGGTLPIDTPAFLVLNPFFKT